MTPLNSPNSTLTAIQTKIRRLTASSSEQSLTTATINEAINTFYQNDFPYAIKLDQLRSVYTFYTSPNIDRYPLNVNFNQGIRSPVFFEGVQGYYFKDRKEFFNMWPRWPTQNNFPSTTLTGSITNITQANPAIVTANNTLQNGAKVSISGVGGMTEVNGATYTVSSVTSTSFALNVDSTGFTAYTSGGTFTSVLQQITFTIPTIPFLGKEVTIGGTDTAGNAIIVNDDGNGKLFYQLPNSIVPSNNLNTILNTTYPGKVNENLSTKVSNSGNSVQTFPGDIIQTEIGTVNYITGVVNFNLATVNVTPEIGSDFVTWVSQYQVGRPYSMLFWNNEFTIRPVPDHTYKVEVETYMTPVQFIENTDNPLLLQWWQYISYGAAMEIQRERNDYDSVEGMREGFMRQEALVLERQGIEEINQRNATIFSSTTPQQGWNAGTGWPY